MTKGIGDKVLGWFIVDEGRGEAEGEPEADAKAKADASAEAKVEARARVTAPVVASGPDQERLAKVIALLETLPAEATPEVKRAIVGASLEAFGVPIDRIVVTGEGTLVTLDAQVVAGQQRTREMLEQAEAQIAKLTSEIAAVRRLMEMQTATQQELERTTAAEKERIRAALDFFGRSGSKKGLRLVS